MSHKFRGESPPAFGLIWQPLAQYFPGLFEILGSILLQLINRTAYFDHSKYIFLKLNTHWLSGLSGNHLYSIISRAF